MEWYESVNTIFNDNWKDGYTISTFSSYVQDLDGSFIVIPRYTTKGTFKDYIAYYISRESRMRSSKLGNRIKNTYSSHEDAIRRCEAIANKLLLNEDCNGSFIGEEIIDENCPTRDFI